MSLPKLDNGKDKDKNIQGLPSLGDIEPDDNFEQVDIGEVIEDDDFENEEIYREIDSIDDETELPTMEEEDDDYFADEDDYNPDFEEDLENNKKRKFIDRKNKKLLPFGGKKSKKSTRKVKSSDLTDRKNVLARTKIIRFIVMLIIALLFLFGLKNTFFPSHVYTDEQIRSFAKQGAGQTNFPRERGEAFVVNFMDAYLTLDRAKPELGEILSYYYGEENFARVGYEKMNMRIGTDTKQETIIGPNIYDVNMLTDYSALFKVSAYVTNTDGTALSGTRLNGRWLSFAINVYYDEKIDALAITPDSPSLIPTPNIAKQADVPPRAPFGNGTVNKQIAPAINPTINGFIQAYAKASIESHESVLQYIDNKNNLDLIDGFGGTVELNGAPDTAIKRTIYDNDDGVYRVDLTVNWIDAVAYGEDNRIEYTSKYIMRVKPEGEGKYSVSSFVPYTFYTH